MSNDDVNWESVRPVFEILRDAHLDRKAAGGPGMVAAIDQEVAFTKELLEETGAKWTPRDIFFVLLTLSACWGIAVGAEQKGTLTREQANAAVTVTSTAAVNIMLSTYPRWLDGKGIEP
jgi:hypothetical protein